jgi:hypothetical protein
MSGESVCLHKPLEQKQTNKNKQTKTNKQKQTKKNKQKKNKQKL